MRNHPGLASCAVLCRHCGIRFLTHPRNANRRDLHCPFGCREHRRRQQANERSKKHYQTDRGGWNKKLLNAKRSAACDQAAWQNQDAVASEVTAAAPRDTSCADTTATYEDVTQTRPNLAHQRAQVGLEEVSAVNVQLPLDGFTLDEATLARSPMLPYLAMVASLIEGRAIRCEELLPTLLRSMRQRSFDRLPRREYALRVLNQHPP